MLRRFNTPSANFTTCAAVHTDLFCSASHSIEPMAQVVLTGSWWSVLLVVPFFPLLVWRILDEEDFLRKDLPGYAEYMESKIPSCSLCVVGLAVGNS